MPDLDEQLKAWADQTDPITAEEARTRADEPVIPIAPTRRPGAGGLLDSPSRRLLAAAAVVILVIGGLVVMTQGGDSEEIQIGEQPQQPDPTEPAPQPTADEVVPAPPLPEGPVIREFDLPVTYSEQPPPAVWVGHDDQHRLVVVDTESGELVRILAELDDPAEVDPTGMELWTGLYLGRIAVTPDGQTVYYETCCEPTIGEVYRIPITGGTPEFVTNGEQPAVSPDGTQLLVVEMQALKIVDLETGEETRTTHDDRIIAWRTPSWSPNGEAVLATWVEMRPTDDDSVESVYSTVQMIDVEAFSPGPDFYGPMLGTGVAMEAFGQHPTWPILIDDSRAEVVYQDDPLGADPAGGTSLRVVPLDDQTVVGRSFGADHSIVSRIRAHGGGPVLTTTSDGSVGYHDPTGDWVNLGNGFHSASW